MEKNDQSLFASKPRSKSTKPTTYNTQIRPRNSLMKVSGTVSNTIKTPYIASFRGPILLSAPHSTRIQRGGPQTQTKERIHLREQWVSTLVLRLAEELDNIQVKVKSSDLQFQDEQQLGRSIRASILVWSKEKRYDKFTLDPNYLVKSQFKDSPFHQALHKFIESQSGVKGVNSNQLIQRFDCSMAKIPLLHLDIHGKKDRANNRTIDLGSKSINEDQHADDRQGFITPLISKLEAEINNVFYGNRLQGFSINCVSNGAELQGKWAQGNMFTVTHQSNLLGIPAFQLEIPRGVRQQLLYSDGQVRQFARAILKTYKEVLAPNWEKRKTMIIVSGSLAKQVIEVKLSNRMIKQLCDEYKNWDLMSQDTLI